MARGEGDSIDPPRGQVIWDDQSVLPGQAGVSLLAGHDEYFGQPDVFWRLGQVPVGAAIPLHCTEGGTQHWRVTKKVLLLKTSLGEYLTPFWHAEVPILVVGSCDPYAEIVNGHSLKNWLLIATQD